MRRIREKITVAVIVLVSLHTTLDAQQPLNFGFEQPGFEGKSRPWGWSTNFYGQTASSAMDSLSPRTGEYALKVTAKDTTYCLSYWIAPRLLRGREIRLRGWIKNSSSHGRAWLGANTWGYPGELDVAKTEDITAAQDWEQAIAAIKIDSAAYTLLVQVCYEGSGEAQFDDLSISVDGKKMEGIPVASDIGKEEMTLLRRHAYPFRYTEIPATIAPDHFDDLSAFGKLVEGAEIIGLGECTHGTSEFFSMKHRILAYAVHHLGTRIFAFEDSQLGVEKVNDYVLNGHGDVDSLFKYLFGVWTTEEVRDMIEWVRSYNIVHPDDKVEFVGFDAQNPTLPVQSIKVTLSTMDPEMLDEVGPLYKEYYDAWQESLYPQSDPSSMKKWYDNALKAERLITDKYAGMLDQATGDNDKSKLSWLIQNAKSVRDAASAYDGDITVRDRYMAENISWIIDQKQPKGPVIVWAHDIHVNHGHGPDDLYNYFQGGSMGTHLRKKYGDRYKAFGFFTYEGSYATYHYGKPIEVPAFPAPGGSIDEALHRLAKRENVHNYILDLAWARNYPYDHFWMMEPRPVRFATYFAADYGYEMMVSLPFQFDGIIYIDKTSAAVKLK